MNTLLQITDKSVGVRLDVFLTEVLADLSRSNIQKLIATEQILVNEKVSKANYKLRLADIISVNIEEPTPIDVLPENIPLDILYEDEDIIVVNKERGMMVHPATNIYTGTLVNALLYHCQGELSGINGSVRPGIVHRLDKDTSGVIIVAKNDLAHQSLTEQLGDKTKAHKQYLALVHGIIHEETGLIDAPIGRHPTDRKKMAVVDSGKPSQTSFRVLERYTDATMVECVLHTGRTHQIRVHFAYIKHPVIGDPKYTKVSNKYAINGQALHAYKLSISHPRTGESMTFTAPIPRDFSDLQQFLHCRSHH